MSSDWHEITFGEFVAIQRGHDLPDQDRKPGSVPILGSFGITGYHDTIRAKAPGVTIGRSGASFGVAVYTDHDYWPLNTALYVTDFKGNHPKFVFYFMKAFDFSGFNSGSAQPSLNRNNLYPVTICIPSPVKQKGIADLLGCLDDRIILLRETNATLEAIAQALFKSWFVDFDPVRAKAAGLEPEGMDAATAALFPDGFEESEQGVVPSGWNLVPFGELLTHTIGGDWGDEVSGDKNDVRVAIVRGTDIPDLQSGTANRVPIRYTSAKKLATRALQDGDLILEVSGGSKDQPTGRSLYLTDALLRQFDCPVEPASFCRLLRPVDRNTSVLLAQHLTYIYAIGKTWEYQNQSTGIANFQTTHFLESELVVMPSAEILEAFSEVIRPIIDRAHLSQIRVLTQLRDTLLPRLISGQLRLPEAEAQIEAVCA